MSDRQSPTTHDGATVAERLSAAKAPVFVGLEELPLESARQAVLLALECRAAVVVNRPEGWARAGLDAPDLASNSRDAVDAADLVVELGAATPCDVELVLRVNLALRDPAAAVGGVARALATRIAAARRVHFVLNADGDGAVLRDCLGSMAARLRPTIHVTYSGEPQPEGLEALTWLTGVPGTLRWLAGDESGELAPYWVPGRFAADAAEPGDLIVDLAAAAGGAP